jgi:hypothetical protein
MTPCQNYYIAWHPVRITPWHNTLSELLLGMTPCQNYSMAWHPFRITSWHDTLSELLHGITPFQNYCLAWHPVRITPCSRVGVCHLIFSKFQLGHMVKNQTLDEGGQFLVLFKPLVSMHNCHVTTEGSRLLPTPIHVWLLYFPAQVKLCNKQNLLYFLKDCTVKSVTWVCPLYNASF